MTVYYVSPSTIPSRSANSIHVANMCEALAKSGYEVVLFCRTESCDRDNFISKLAGFYGINTQGINYSVYCGRLSRGNELGIAVRAFFRLLKDVLAGRAPKFIVSRNLYAALFLGVILCRPVIYETHAPESGFRKILQSLVVKSSRIKTVVISTALKRIITDLYQVQENQVFVFHDAAREGYTRKKESEKLDFRHQFLDGCFGEKRYKKIIGYFGHLYPGRGIEIIVGLAERNPECGFLVYGGTNELVLHYKRRSTSDNLYIMGHIPPGEVRKNMEMVDMLLMPYQNEVSVGLANVNTVQWMSPMKLFEYMSVGVPVIASDLPVLREVLTNMENCLLVTPDDVQEWDLALKKLVNSPELSERIGSMAYKDYVNKYTWTIRAQGMLGLLGERG